MAERVFLARTARLAPSATICRIATLGKQASDHLVESCSSTCFFLLQEVTEKETIAGELAAAEPRLLQTHRGPVLLKR